MQPFLLSFRREGVRERSEIESGEKGGKLEIHSVYTG